VFSIGTDGDADSIDGGSGKDSLALIGSFGWTLLATGIANETGGQTSMSFVDSVVGGTGFDSLEGGSLVDGLFGGDGNDTLDGGTGGDWLYGGANLDVLRGGDDGDRLFGGAANDTLQSDGGNDTLTGGAGTDTLTGGAGVDRFVWTDIADGGLGEDADVISDFATGVDKLNLGAIDGLTWIDTAAFSNVAGQVRQATSGGTTVISIDTDGNAVADMEIVLQSALTGIVAGDLLL
jgi:serralysin